MSSRNEYSGCFQAPMFACEYSRCPGECQDCGGHLEIRNQPDSYGEEIYCPFCEAEEESDEESDEEEDLRMIEKEHPTLVEMNRMFGF